MYQFKTMNVCVLVIFTRIRIWHGQIFRECVLSLVVVSESEELEGGEGTHSGEYVSAIGTHSDTAQTTRRYNSQQKVSTSGGQAQKYALEESRGDIDGLSECVRYEEIVVAWEAPFGRVYNGLL